MYYCSVLYASGATGMREREREQETLDNNLHGKREKYPTSEVMYRIKYGQFQNMSLDHTI